MYHSRQKRKVICSSAFFCCSPSEGAGEADIIRRLQGAVEALLYSKIAVD